MLEFDGEQADHLDGDTRGARDARRRVVIVDVDLADVARGDHVARSGPPITGEHHTPA